MNEISREDQLKSLLGGESQQPVRDFFEQLQPEEAPRVLSRLSPAEQAQTLAALAPERAARIVDELPLTMAVDMLETLPPEPAAAILNRLPSDLQTDVLTELEPSQAEAVLARMAPGEAADVERLRGYPGDTAGGMMVTEYLAYPETLRVGDVVADLRTHALRYAEFQVQYAYVVSADGKLLGVASLRNLLFLPDELPLSRALTPNPAAVPIHARLDELRSFFDRHAFLAAPIVDENRRLVGVLTRAAVEEAVVERAEKSLLRFGGIVMGEEFRSMPLMSRVSGRMAWLGITLALNLLAASVVGFFEETLSAVIALAVFLPVISGMSGNAGNQAVAVTMRELALGLVKPHELIWVTAREATVGAINGLALGLLLSLAAFAWKGNPYLGLVVGCSQALSALTAVCLGGTIPLMLARAGMDPALASAPILTTITDATGFFLALGFATLMLPMLT